MTMQVASGQDWRSVRRHGLRLILAIGLAFSLAGCDDELYRNLTQRDANEMVAVLARHGISATRQAGEGGSYRLVLTSGSFATAVEVLRQSGYPRENFRSIADVFPGDGLVSSPFEQRARLTYALNQEIARTLSAIDGVVSARVLVVMPEADLRGVAQTRSSASVMIQHLPSIDPDELAPKIRQLVASSVAGLSYRDVTLAFFPAAGDTGDNGPLTTSSVRAAGAGDGLLFFVAIALAFAAAIATWRTLRAKAS